MELIIIPPSKVFDKEDRTGHYQISGKALLVAQTNE
jgi:putative NADH-flavin reductase